MSSISQKQIDFLDSVGISGAIIPLPGGANSRVYKVETPHSLYLLKEYYQPANLHRDRLLTEFTFCRYAHGQGIRFVPKPIAMDHRNNFAIYEYLAGSKLVPGQVTQNHVRQAAQFVMQLNVNKNSGEARGLPDGAESCFSVELHLQMLKNRVNRLTNIGEEVERSAVDKEARTFIISHLAPKADELIAKVSEQLSGDKALSIDERIVSPSDFGYHNAIQLNSGELRFIDFEYSGWDDPVKLVCDFFCQPAVPVPREYFELFIQKLATFIDDKTKTKIDLLLPVYQCKWCCILLNEFLPSDSSRREFANQRYITCEYKENQLSKAQALLNAI